MSPIDNPVTLEGTCDSCGEAYPVSILSPYVDETKTKKGIVSQKSITACPICISEKAGKRMGLKEPFDFSADKDMTQKLAYATQLKEQRSPSKKPSQKNSDDDELSKAEEKRLAEEEAELQQQIEEEERNRAAAEEPTDMLDRSDSTSADDEDEEKKGSRSRGSNK